MQTMKPWTEAELIMLEDIVAKVPRVVGKALFSYFPDRTAYSVQKRAKRAREEARRAATARNRTPSAADPAPPEPVLICCLRCRGWFKSFDRRRNRVCYECHRIDNPLGPDMMVAL